MNISVYIIKIAYTGLMLLEHYSWFATHAEALCRMIHTFDSASRISLSSIPSPVNQCKKAFRRYMQRNCSPTRKNNSYVWQLQPWTWYSNGHYMPSGTICFMSSLAATTFTFVSPLSSALTRMHVELPMKVPLLCNPLPATESTCECDVTHTFWRMSLWTTRSYTMIQICIYTDKDLL